MSTIWFDSEYESEEETTNRVIAFTEKYESGSESSDKELDATYKLLYIKWKEACMVGEKQRKTISALLQEKEKFVSTISGLK